jgi:hypothetical protein
MLARYRWPILLSALATGLFVLATWVFAQGFGGWSTSFIGPGTSSVDLPAAGDYRIWHESKTVIDGQLQVHADALPSGSVIRVTRPSDVRIPLEPTTGTLLQEWDGRRRFAIGNFSAPDAGTYTISITGFEQARRFRLSEIRFLDHLLRALGIGLLGAVLATAAIIHAIVLATRKSRQD